MRTLLVTISLLALIVGLARAPVRPSVSPHLDDLSVPAEGILRRFPTVMKVETHVPRLGNPQGRLVHIVGVEPEMLRVLVQMHGVRKVYSDGLPDETKHAGLENVRPTRELAYETGLFALAVTTEAEELTHRPDWEYVRVTTTARYGQRTAKPPDQSTRPRGR